MSFAFVQPRSGRKSSLIAAVCLVASLASVIPTAMADTHDDCMSNCASVWKGVAASTCPSAQNCSEAFTCACKCSGGAKDCSAEVSTMAVQVFETFSSPICLQSGKTGTVDSVGIVETIGTAADAAATETGAGNVFLGAAPITANSGSSTASPTATDTVVGSNSASALAESTSSTSSTHSGNVFATESTNSSLGSSANSTFTLKSTGAKNSSSHAVVNKTIATTSNGSRVVTSTGTASGGGVEMKVTGLLATSVLALVAALATLL